VQAFPFTFLQPRHCFSVRLPRAPTLVSRQRIDRWPGIGACERSEFAVVPIDDGDPDLYLELYAAIDVDAFDDDEQRRWMHELASRVGDGPVLESSTWARGALLVSDPEGLTLVVPVRAGVLLLNFDAVVDVDVIAAEFFGSFLVLRGQP